MQKFYLSITLVMFSLISMAQTGSTLEGKVVDSKTQSPLQSVVVSIQNTALMQITDASGQFLFPDVPVGKHFILINSQGYINQLFEIEVIENQALDLGTIVLEFDVADDLALNIISLSENDLSEDFGGADNTAGLLQASRDTYNQAAAFNWNLGWFRIRGLDNELSTTMINGITMNKIATGRPQWNNWGGLNDATRNQEFTMGSAPSDYVFGSILGT
ncbi:MAG: carboxypeptidase-like regulatory domain-containing protein, partial [Flavobacterium sp.]